MFSAAITSLLIAVPAAVGGYQELFVIAILSFAVNAIVVIVGLDERIPHFRRSALSDGAPIPDAYLKSTGR